MMARRFAFAALLTAVAGVAGAQAKPAVCEPPPHLVSPLEHDPVNKVYIERRSGEYYAPRASLDVHRSDDPKDAYRSVDLSDAHRGVDLVTEKPLAASTIVRAMAKGTVVFAKPRQHESRDAGVLVIVEHEEGCYSVYALLDRVEVSVGAPVSAGQKLGVLREKSFDLDANGNIDDGQPEVQQLHVGLFEARPRHLQSRQNEKKPLFCPLRWRDPSIWLTRFGYGSREETPSGQGG